jgi:hypothetical protein
MEFNNLPCYQLQIDPDEKSNVQVDYVALVDMPAIEKDFLAFSGTVKPLRFEVQNEDRRIISGPAMLANVPIYRRDPEMGEYYVVFSPETIYDIAQKFFAKGFNQNFNLMHDPKEKVQGVNVFESFIVDKSRGIQPMAGFEDAQDGSWFISAKVNNDEVWAKIKAGEVKGFSVEGLFQYKKPKLSQDQVYAKIQELLKNLES